MNLNFIVQAKAGSKTIDSILEDTKQEIVPERISIGTYISGINSFKKITADRIQDHIKNHFKFLPIIARRNKGIMNKYYKDKKIHEAVKNNFSCTFIYIKGSDRNIEK